MRRTTEEVCVSTLASTWRVARLLDTSRVYSSCEFCNIKEQHPNNFHGSLLLLLLPQSTLRNGFPHLITVWEEDGFGAGLGAGLPQPILGGDIGAGFGGGATGAGNVHGFGGLGVDTCTVEQ